MTFLPEPVALNSTFEAAMRSWAMDPWLVASLLVTAVVYVRGWRRLRRRGARAFTPARLACFLGGLATIYIALQSPIEPFSALLFQVHMTQHLLLMMLAPPLIWLGFPALPLLVGLPASIRQRWAAPLLRNELLRRALNVLTSPIVAWMTFVAMTWLWHVPALFDLALRSPQWHIVEHAAFLFSALLFWWPVVQPYPSKARWSRWILLPYLFLADVQNTVLSAILTFSNVVLYPSYLSAPRIGGLTALDDQAAAGVLMWVPGSLAFLIPLVWIGMELLSGRSSNRRAARPVRRAPSTVPTSPAPLLPILSAREVRTSQDPGRRSVPGRWDLLKAPLVGRFLTWPRSRLVLQSLAFTVAALVIADGLFGPQVAPMNLAGVVPWIHWRGLVVIGLLAAGNVFCMACPFQLPRSLGRRWLGGSRNWPPWFRSKWLAIALLLLFFWAYEVFSLWESPWWTGWIAIGYFAAALVVDGWFRGGSFCKHVCPIGQFQFALSLNSPLEVAVRDTATCTTCATKDCIRGRDELPGCELRLFQPLKAGNLDCTFCLDCVHACPHDNIGILAVAPGSELASDRRRSGIGRWSSRRDVAALVVTLVFAAFASAAAMTAPVAGWRDRTTARLGLSSPLPIETLSWVASLVVAPLLLVSLCNALSRWWAREAASDAWLGSAARGAMALAPLGAAMWLAHFGFHLATGGLTIVPVTQRLAMDFGGGFLGTPFWDICSDGPTPTWLLRAQILALDVGLLLSLASGYRVMRDRYSRTGAAARAFLPWSALMVALFALGIWIVFQPMQMRGTTLMLVGSPVP